MEKIFHARWWDYSDEKFNLNGRICGQNALLFGLGSILVIYYIHPLLFKIESIISNKTLTKITIFLLIIFVIDTIISFNIINRLKNTITAIDSKKDSTQEISKKVTEYLLKSHRIFQKRLLSAFPNVELKNLKAITKDIRKKIKLKQNK